MRFAEASRIGKAGEAFAHDYLLQNDFLVINASQHKLFQELDIDIVAQSTKTDVVYTIDIKHDSNASDNFFIEKISNTNSGSPGAIYATRADFWWYIMGHHGKVFVFKPEQMRSHIEQNHFPERTATTHGFQGDVLYKSVGCLVPIKSAPIVQTLPYSGNH